MYGSPFSTDGSLVLPTEVLGSEYNIASWANDKIWTLASNGFNLGTFFGVVATQDNTTITIQPSEIINLATPEEQPADIAFNITLNRGETYQGISDSFTDMTGNLISADKPVAVFSGDTCAGIRDIYCDHLVEQLIPAKSLGTEFLSLPLADRVFGDTVRFVGAYDNTYVWVNGELTAFLNQGSFHEMHIAGPAHIVSSRPMTVAQFSNGGVFDGTQYDPAMVVLPALEQYVDTHIVTTVNDRMPVNYLNIILPADAVDSVRVDGAAIDPGLWLDTGRADYKGAQIPVALGQHSATADKPMMLVAYGWGTWESYLYQGGMEISRQTTADTLSLSLNRVNPRVGEEVCPVSS